MLRLTIPDREFWDEVNEQFIYKKGQTITLEHSLVSISKWESLYCKPFLRNKEKPRKEMIDYIRCMTITQNVDHDIYENITDKEIKSVKKYIDEPMTATTLNYYKKQSSQRESVTSEVIYYWMIMQGIPFECQKWHLNRLLTLIGVCNIKNSSKKMSTREVMERNTALNAARKKKYNTRG